MTLVRGGHLLMSLTPFYTRENCKWVYQLNWSLAVFWKCQSLASGTWLEALKEATERDDCGSWSIAPKGLIPANSCLVRNLMYHHLRRFGRSRDGFNTCFRKESPSASATITRSKASVQPTQMQWIVMWRPNQNTIGWPTHRTQELLSRYQFHDATVDLTEVRRSASGEFLHNLQLVLVHDQRLSSVHEATLRRTVETARRIAAKKGHLLSRLGIAADHLHFTLGCDVDESPEDVAFAYLNNLAYSHGMKPVFQFGFYVGTFGTYDLQAVRRSLSFGNGTRTSS